MTNDSHDDQQHAIAVLTEMIDSVPVMMLTVRLRDGSLRSVPVARVQSKFDGTVYLFADPAGETVAELHSPVQVNLSYADVPQCRYVSLSGEAEVVSDRTLAERLWNADYREWLPRGVQDPLHGLFRVTVQQAEYWDAAHSAMRQIGGLMKGLFTGTRPAVGDHESIDLTGQ